MQFLGDNRVSVNPQAAMEHMMGQQPAEEVKPAEEKPAEEVKAEEVKAEEVKMEEKMEKEVKVDGEQTEEVEL